MATTTEHPQHGEHQHHHEMPTSGGALTGVAISATLHCLTGCAIGEIAGMAIGTALGLSNFATIVLAIALAFLFGYSLTSLPLLRSGLALAAVVPIALASDTLSIATMEIVDNLVLVAIPGAMHAGLGDVLFWGSLAFALVVAGVVAVPVNRYLIARGKGHAVVHETGVHGGPPSRSSPSSQRSPSSSGARFSQPRRSTREAPASTCLTAGMRSRTRSAAWPCPRTA